MQRDEVEGLYERFGPALLAYACSLLGRRPAAEDVLHQVFLNLIAGEVSQPEHPKAYLYRAVKNASYNVRRAAAHEVEMNPTEPWFEAKGGAVEESIALQAALVQLPAEQREVVVMRVWAELRFEEIAEITGVGVNTAASRYRYGLKKLRELLSPNEVNEHAARK